jgi:hypothetical protein
MVVFPLSGALVLLGSLVLVWRRVVVPLLLLAIRLLLAVLSKLLLVLLLVVGVLWNSDSPVISCRLFSKSATTGCASQTPAGTGGGTMEQRLTRS